MRLDFGNDINLFGRQEEFRIINTQMGKTVSF